MDDITLATKDDLDGILALQTQIYNISNLPDNARQMLNALIDSNTCDIIVAKENGIVLGTGTIFYLPVPAHGKPAAYLEGIVVDEKARAKGIGTALAKKCIDLAREKKCYKIIFTSSYKREVIHKFYENLGFKNHGLEFRMDLD